MEQQHGNGKQPENEVLELLVDFAPEVNNTNKIVFLGLGLTTIYTVFNTALPKFEALGFLGNVGVRIAASVVALFIYRLFDGDLRKNVVTALRALRSNDWSHVGKGVRSVAVFFAVLAGLRLLLSGGATLISSIFIGDDLVADGNTEVVEDVVQRRQQNKAFVLKDYEQQISQAQRTQSARISQAKKRGQELVDAAVASGTPSQREMWKANQGFFTSLNPRSKYYKTNKAYYERIQQAKKQAEELEDSERILVSRLRTDKARELSQVAEDTTETMLLALETRIIEKAALKELVITASLTSVDLLLFILAILTSNMLALVIPYRPDYEFFDDTPSIAPVIWKGLTTLYRIVVNSLGYGVHLVDNVAVAQLNKIGDGSGVLPLLSKDVILKKGASDTKQRASDTEQSDADTGGAGGPGDTEPGRQEQPRDTEPPKRDTEPPKRDTEPPKRDAGRTVIEIPQITAEEITLIKKRARRNWERSFAEHKDAPKDENLRKQLRSKAEEEIETLRLLGYKVYQSHDNPMRLEMDSPAESKKTVTV